MSFNVVVGAVKTTLRISTELVNLSKCARVCVVALFTTRFLKVCLAAAAGA